MATPTRSGIVAFGLKYRKLVILVTVVLVCFGIYALDVMDKNEFPSFTVREGVVAAVCPGVDPSRLSDEVLKPLEDYIFSYKEVDKTSSHSRATSGMVIVFVELDDNVEDTEQFWNKFQHGLSALRASMPKGVVAIEALTDFGDTSSILVSLSSRDKTYRELGTYMDNMRDALRPIASVGSMEVYGKQKEQIAVYVDNEKLVHYGIKSNLLALTLFNQGFNTTGGELKGPDYTTPIYVNRPVNSVADVADMIVMSTPEGSVVRLGDIARVVREYPDPDSYITNNGVKALLLSVSMKDGDRKSVV